MAMRLLFCLLLSLCSLAVWAQQAGRVDYLEGSVKLVDAASKERFVKLGDGVNEGDTLVTGADSEVHLAMEDGGQLGIHANTRLRILNYKAEGGKDDRSVFNLLQGAMRSITGWIGKYNPRNYEIRTPTATIGVRGTDHETRIIPQGSSEGEAGTYDKVNIGATQMRTQYGTTEIRPNRPGFVSFTGQARLLDRVPAFFRPLRNEARFVGLHDRIKQRLPEQRAARVRQIGETRKQQNLEKQQAARSERQKQQALREQQRQQYQQHMEQRRQERQRDLLDKHRQKQQTGERRGQNEWMSPRQNPAGDFDRGQTAVRGRQSEHEKHRPAGQHLRQ